MPKVSQLLRPTDIPQSLLDEMAQACGESFAISYLSGAMVRRNILIPWTVTAWNRLQANRDAMGVIRVAELRLEKPEPFGSPHHPASLRMAAE